MLDFRMTSLPVPKEDFAAGPLADFTSWRVFQYADPHIKIDP